MRAPLLLAIHVYKRVLAPLIPPTCRFEPTCSVFAAEAVRRHGAWHGGRMALGRLCRCRPGGGGGADPVPPLKSSNPGADAT